MRGAGPEERGVEEKEPDAAPPAPPPRVSIVMPVFNGVRFLDESLRSVRAQTLRDWELLVVDDGSADGSVVAVRRHVAQDPRIRLLRQPHRGVVAARNHAIGVARAPLIALWDHDDLGEPERLEVQLAFLEANPDVGVLGAFAWHIGERGRVVGVSEFGPTTREAFRMIKAANGPLFALASSVVFRGDAARAAGGFRQGMAPAEDTDLWTRIADQHVVLNLPRRLVRYRVHAGSVSSSSFFEQMERNELVGVNAARRRAGWPELDPLTMHDILRRDPLARRLDRARVWHSRHLYRIGGGLLADGHPCGAIYLAGSALLAPMVVTRRLRRQVAPHLKPGRDAAAG